MGAISTSNADFAADLRTSDAAVDFAHTDASHADFGHADAKLADMVTVVDMTHVAFLNGAETMTNNLDVNLTTEGTSDWIALGYNGSGDVEHKDSGASQINVNGSTNVMQAMGNGSARLSWTDGTPTQSASSTTTSVYMGTSSGNSFTITAPADTKPRTLRLYIGVSGNATLTAKLGDGSASDYTDTQSVQLSSFEYTLNYAAQSSTNLVVTWTATTDNTYLGFQAATLSETP